MPINYELIEGPDWGDIIPNPKNPALKQDEIDHALSAGTVTADLLKLWKTDGMTRDEIIEMIQSWGE